MSAPHRFRLFIRPTAGFAWLPALGAGVVLVAAVFAGLWAFRLHNRALLAEQDAQISATEVQALEHDLEIERLLSERLASTTIDLGAVLIAPLSTADAANLPQFAVVWSPSSGEGVLVHLGDHELPATAHFVLTATRQPTSDRLVTDPIFAAAAPEHFDRGLFTYQPEHAKTVTAFRLVVTDSASSDSTVRYGGAVRP